MIIISDSCLKLNSEESSVFVFGQFCVSYLGQKRWVKVKFFLTQNLTFGQISLEINWSDDLKIIIFAF